MLLRSALSGLAIYVGEVGFVFGCVLVVELILVVVLHPVGGGPGGWWGTVDDNISETFFMICV